MRYRTKLFLTFVLMVVLSTCTALGIIYHGTHTLVFNQIRSQLLSIAVTASASINGDLLQSWTTPESTSSPAYTQLVQQLRSERDLHRRSDIFVRYIYILRKIAPQTYIFVLDAEEDPKKVSHLGDPAPVEKESLETLGDIPFVTKNSYRDSWGTWITGYAPIYNSKEKMVGILGVDMSMHYVHKELHHLFIYGLIALVGALLVAIVIAYILAKIVTSSLNMICTGILAIQLGDLNTRIYLNTNDEFNDLAIAINDMARNIKEKERLTISFGRYVSHHVLETILHTNTPTHLEGERKKVTVLFCDIHQFTMISEHFPPEVVVSLLNEYLEKMIILIFANHGTLDKFIGDGIMAEFGVPLEDPSQEVNAIKTALAMQEMVTVLSQEWKEKYDCDMAVGIGIHTGFAVVGNIGSNVRMEYTAIGDTVNVASRLEKATKTLSIPILISEETYKNIHGTHPFQCKDLGLIQLYGRETPIKAYAVLPLNSTQDELS